MKNNYSKTAHTFSRAVQCLATFLPLNCYNFRIALTKSIKLRFLEKKLAHQYPAFLTFKIEIDSWLRSINLQIAY